MTEMARTLVNHTREYAAAASTCTSRKRSWNGRGHGSACARRRTTSPSSAAGTIACNPAIAALRTLVGGCCATINAE